MAAPATPKAVNGGADSTLRSTTGAVYGFALRATTDSVLRLRAISSSGIIVIPITLLAGQSTSESWPGGIVFDRGVYEDWVSGAYEGSVFIGDA